MVCVIGNEISCYIKDQCKIKEEEEDDILHTGFVIIRQISAVEMKVERNEFKH